MSDDELNRVVVRIGPGYPELREHLRGLPPNARAERLRSLATTGLLMHQGHIGGAVAPPSSGAPAQGQPAQQGESAADAERRERFARLRSKFADAE